MSACRKYETRLEDYLQAQLNPADAAELEAHLRGCAACREALEAAQEVGALLREAIAPAPEPGAAFWANLRTAIALADAERTQQGDFWRSLEFLAQRFAWSTAIAVVVLTAYLAGFDAFHPEGNGTAQAEIREVFSEPVSVPANNEEALLALVTRENGR